MEEEFVYYTSQAGDLLAKTRRVTLKEKKRVCTYLGIDSEGLGEDDMDFAIGKAAQENEMILDDIYTTKSDLGLEMDQIVKAIFDLRIAALKLVSRGYDSEELIEMSQELGGHWYCLAMHRYGTVELDYINGLMKLCEDNIESARGIPKEFLDQAKSDLKK